MRVLDDDAEREFRAFVHAHTPSLARTAYLLMNDAHLAEDVLQSVLANTALRWTTAAEHPEAYVRKALYHQAISWWRWRGRRPESLPGVLPEVSTVMTVSSAAVAGVLEVAQDVVQGGGFGWRPISAALDRQNPPRAGQDACPRGV